MTASPDLITVGCGIADVSLACFLAERGKEGPAFEREGPATGGTSASVAIMRQQYSTRVMTRLNATGPWVLALAQAGIVANVASKIPSGGAWRSPLVDVLDLKRR